MSDIGSGKVPITIVGNLTRDPELRFTLDGHAVTNCDVALNPRHYDKDSGDWVAGEAQFYRITAWRQIAESMAELVKGQRVIVVGLLTLDYWEDESGTKRVTPVVEVDDLGPSLKFTETPGKLENANTITKPATKKTPADAPRTRTTVSPKPLKRAAY